MKTARLWKTLREWKEHHRYSLPPTEVEARMTRWALTCESKDFSKAREYAGRVGGKMHALFECSLVPLRLRKRGNV